MINALAYYCTIFLLSPLIVIGLVGNCLSMLTWSRGSHRYTSTAVLLTALAVCDTIVLVMPALEFWALYIFDVMLRTQHVFMCKLLPFFAFFGPGSSSCILVLVTAERATSMMFPVKVRYICTRPKVGICLLVILLILAGIYSPVVIETKLIPKYSNKTNSTYVECNVPVTGNFMRHYYKEMMWIDFCCLFLVPFILIVIGNALIMYKITSSRRKFIKDRHRLSDRTRFANSFTIRAIALSITFFVCMSPVAIFDVAKAYNMANEVNKAGEVLIHVLLYGNCSINFILYCVIGTGFRKDLKMVLRRLCFGKTTGIENRDPSNISAMNASSAETFLSRLKISRDEQEC